MLPFSALIGAALGLLILPACSTPQTRAHSFAYDGKFAEAIAEYDQALAQDPKDDDSRAQRQEAREGWIRAEILRIQELQAAERADDALTALTGLGAQVAKWRAQIPADSQNALSQAQSSSLTRLQEIARSSAAQGYIYSGLVKVKAHESAFALGMSGEMTRLKAELTDQARGQCHGWYRMPVQKTPMLSLLFHRLCQRMGIAPPEELKVLPALRKIEDTLIRTTQTQVGVESLPSDAVLEAGDHFNRAVARTPYFEISGRRVLPVRITGNFLDESRKTPTRLTHKYKDGSEPKEFVHAGWTLERKVSITLHAEAPMPGGTVRADGKARANDQWTVHFNSIPAIGLSPSPGAADFDSAGNSKWASEQIAILARAFAQELTDRWRHSFCPRALLANASAIDGERAVACARLFVHQPPGADDVATQAALEKIESWFQKQFGLSFKEVLTE